MIKKMIKKIVIILFYTMLFFSFINLNSYAIEQEILDNAIKINTVDDNGVLIEDSFHITETGDYVIVGSEMRRQIIIKSGGTEENPIRIFITEDFTSDITNESGVKIPLFSITQADAKYIEIIGVGNKTPIIKERSYTNVVMYQSSSKNTSLKMENLIIDAVGGHNIINTQSNTGEKTVELTNMTFQNWHSTNSGFSVNLSCSNGGKMNAKLTNCTFKDNSGMTGGGLVANGNSTNRAIVEMINCKFENNYNSLDVYAIANTGGSVNARPYATIIMKGGYITGGTGNGTTPDGFEVPGGISIASTAECILEDVQITNNNGYGVFNAGTLTLKGNTNITDNDNGNIYLPSNKYVIVDESYNGISGITVQNPPDYNTERQITAAQGAKDYQNKLKNLNIKSDNKDYIVKNGLSNYLYLWKHSHTWIYFEEGNVIEAYCQFDPECYYHDHSIDLVLNTEDMIYTGREYDKASVENYITEVTGEPAGEIYYAGTGTTNYVESTIPPIEEGTYKATISLGGEIAESNFSISRQKRSITAIIDWEDNNNSYNERPQNVIIELLQNDVVIQEIELNEEKSWKYEFKDLEISDSSDNEYVYSVRVKSDVGGYYLRNIEQTEDTITLINTKYGKIRLSKEDLLTGEKLEGAAFRLERRKSDTEWEIIGEYTSDSSGIIVINNLTYGTYKLKEIKAPDGYNLNLENAEVELEISEANANYELTVSNKAQPVLPETGTIGKILTIIIGCIVITIGKKIYIK